jgi:hypothetical protein
VSFRSPQKLLRQAQPSIPAIARAQFAMR